MNQSISVAFAFGLLAVVTPVRGDEPLVADAIAAKRDQARDVWWLAADRGAFEADAPAVPVLPAETYWDLKRTGVGGAVQKGAFRIVAGQVYHQDQNHAVGTAFQDSQGRLHLSFHGHRKIAGNAVVEKVANKRWTGPLVMPDGSEWLLELTRKR